MNIFNIILYIVMRYKKTKNDKINFKEMIGIDYDKLKVMKLEEIPVSIFNKMRNKITGTYNYMNYSITYSPHYEYITIHKDKKLVFSSRLGKIEVNEIPLSKIMDIARKVRGK